MVKVTLGAALALVLLALLAGCAGDASTDATDDVSADAADNASNADADNSGDGTADSSGIDTGSGTDGTTSDGTTPGGTTPGDTVSPDQTTSSEQPQPSNGSQPTDTSSPDATDSENSSSGTSTQTTSPSRTSRTDTTTSRTDTTTSRTDTTTSRTDTTTSTPPPTTPFQPTQIAGENCHSGLPSLQVSRASGSQQVELERFITLRNVISIAFSRQASTGTAGTNSAGTSTNTLSGFVATRSGLIYSFTAPTDDAGNPTARATLSPAPALDLSADISTGFEYGLFSIAFGPAEEWLYYNRTKRNGDSLLAAAAISGATLPNGTIDYTQSPTLGPEVELLRVPQPFANHNGGDVVFDSQGYLYVSFGDGGSANDPHGNGQNLNTLLGSILRLAVDPAAPASRRALPAPGNPYIGIAGTDDRIWASGARNSFRMSYDRTDRQLWVADVGQSCMEEITALGLNEGGANLGWSVYEGFRSRGGTLTRPHRPPDFAYRLQSGKLCAVVGGQVYRGTALPALAGHFIWSDLCAGRVYASDIDTAAASASGNGGGNRASAAQAQRTAAAIDLGVQGGQVWGIAADPIGETYLIDSESGIYRLAPAN